MNLFAIDTKVLTLKQEDIRLLWTRDLIIKMISQCETVYGR